MTFCAGQELQAADPLSTTPMPVPSRRPGAKDADGHTGSAVPITDLLRDAQRAWIPFRDKRLRSGIHDLGRRHRPVDGLLTCKTRLTERRTEDLNLFTHFPN